MRKNKHFYLNYRIAMLKKLTFMMLLVCCAACRQQDVQIVILSTNDMHAYIDDYAKVAAYVEQEREKNPNVLVLSGGDLFSGNPIVDYCPQYGNGYPIIDLMNCVGYDFSVIGNHEFDYGQNVLNDRIEQATFPLLCANMTVGDSAKIRQPKGYANIEIGGVKIGIISAVQVKEVNGKLIPATHPDRLKGITFTEPVEALCALKDMRKDCDLFIALTHTGVYTDKKIAEQMPELDLIVGGHTHTKLDTGIVVNGVLITQASEYLKYIGKTTITLRNGKIIAKKNKLINLAKLKDENDSIKSLITRYYEESPMNEVIGEAVKQFDGQETLGNLMTDAITSVHQTDFAFQNIGGVRIGMMEKGPITMGKIYELDPFNNRIVVIKMKPDEIRSLIKNAHRRSSECVDLFVSGMTYTIYTKEGRSDRIEMRLKNGKLLDENKYYRVGINDYISSVYTFDHKNEPQITDKTSEETIVEYIRNEKRLAPQRYRTKIIEN